MTEKETEEWRDIPGYEPYQASNLGRVRRGAKGHAQPAGKILKTPLDRNGYHKVHLFVGGRYRCTHVHRVVCIAFHGEPTEDKPEAGHREQPKTNNRSDNLRWVDHQEQADDRERHGTYWHVVGEDHPMRVLSDELVLGFRAQAKAGKPIKHIAKDAGFAYLTVYDAVKGKTWSHI